MKITLYKNSSESAVLSKSLQKLATVDCQIKEECDVLRPVITLGKASVPDWSQANYAYIDTFDRNYHATVSVTTAGEIIVRCVVDPLTSWASYIRQIKCTVLRQENNYSPYFQDGNLAKRVNRKYVYKQVGKLTSGQSNILTVDGGKYNV